MFVLCRCALFLHVRRIHFNCQVCPEIAKLQCVVHGWQDGTALLKHRRQTQIIDFLLPHTWQELKILFVTTYQKSSLS